MATKLLFYPDGSVLKTDTSLPPNIPDDTYYCGIGANGDTHWVCSITVPYKGNLNHTEWMYVDVQDVPPEYKVKALLLA